MESLSLFLEFEPQHASSLGHCALVCDINRALNRAYHNNLDRSIFACICMFDVHVYMHVCLGGGICS